MQAPSMVQRRERDLDAGVEGPLSCHSHARKLSHHAVTHKHVSYAPSETGLNLTSGGTSKRLFLNYHGYDTRFPFDTTD